MSTGAPGQVVGPRRAMCPRCQRALPACFCHLVRPFVSGPQVAILRHPQERNTRQRVNTATMTHHCVANSVLLDGLDFSRHPLVSNWFEQETWLVFPGKQALDLSTAPERLGRQACPRLIFLDCSWTCAGSLLRYNPRIAALPRLTFQAPAPSLYTFRRQPRDGCVSTAEAVFWSLEILHPWFPSQPPGAHHNLIEVLRFLVECQRPRAT